MSIHIIIKIHEMLKQPEYKYNIHITHIHLHSHPSHSIHSIHTHKIHCIRNITKSFCQLCKEAWAQNQQRYLQEILFNYQSALKKYRGSQQILKNKNKQLKQDMQIRAHYHIIAISLLQLKNSIIPKKEYNKNPKFNSQNTLYRYP